MHIENLKQIKVHYIESSKKTIIVRGDSSSANLLRCCINSLETLLQLEPRPYPLLVSVDCECHFRVQSSGIHRRTQSSLHRAGDGLKTFP